MVNDKNSLQKDFELFLTSSQIVPDTLLAGTLIKIQKMIKPDARFIFLKLLATHIVIGFLSLSVCHQFDINPFNTENSLSDWFMQIGGHNLCMIFCGVFFLGSSVFAASYFFSVEEIRALRRTEFLQIIALGLFSLGLFASFGVVLVVTFAGLWFLGSLLGGILATETMYRIKTTKI